MVGFFGARSLLVLDALCSGGPSWIRPDTKRVEISMGDQNANLPLYFKRGGEFNHEYCFVFCIV